jgi:hypothetical protein
MKLFLIICMLFAGSSFLKPQDTEYKTVNEIKRWHLRSLHAKAFLVLSKGDSESTRLSLETEDDSRLTTGEQADLLRQVLQDKSSPQTDPGKLNTISIWIRESEFQEGIEHALFQSGNWKTCIGRKYCYQLEGLADHFLLSIDAFKAFDPILQQFGLRRKGVSVDGLEVSDKLGQVHCSGLIFVALERRK